MCKLITTQVLLFQESLIIAMNQAKRRFPGGSVVKNPPANAGETWVRSLGRQDPLEKEMATHSSILALGKPIDGELDKLQSMELQRFGHN